MDNHFLHSSLFKTVKEMTASNNSLHLKEVSCFWLQFQENEKYHIGMTRKRYFCLFILVFVILYTMVDKNPLLTKYFSLNMQLMMHQTFHCDLFIKAASCSKNLAVI